MIAGSVLLAITIRRGDVRGDPVTRTQWWAAFVVGALLIAGGNGSVVLAERTIPSGTVALIFALVPLDRPVRPDRRPPPAPAPRGGRPRPRIRRRGVARRRRAGGRAPAVGPAPRGRGVRQLGRGSLTARNAALPHRPFVGNAMVMMAGAISLVWGIARGELALVDPERFSAASVLALLYLIVFGSWIAFSAYLWLLRNARTSLVATYAWVTPMLAVYLGYLIADEPIRGRSLAGRRGGPRGRRAHGLGGRRRAGRRRLRRPGAAGGGRGRGPALARSPRAGAAARPAPAR